MQIEPYQIQSANLHVEKKHAVSYTSYKTMKHYLTIASVVLALTALISTSCSSAPEKPGSSQGRAAIIDQLYLLEPNPSFITEATAILESGGFKVDLWQGQQVTVDFYRELPKRGYSLIVLRVHSGLLLSMEESGVEPLKTTYLFTGETYTTTKYVSEQLTNKVSNAMMSEKYPLVFAINSEFIRKDCRGNFGNAAIVAMGCESYYLDDIATAFIEKGACAYIGWSTLVSLEYVDTATLDLLGNLCTQNMTMAQAISRTMADVGNDPYFNAYLKHYPVDIGGKNIKELIK